MCAEDVWPARVGERAEPCAPLPCSAPRTNVPLQGTAGETEGRESPGVEGPGPTRRARLRGSRGAAARTPGSPQAGPPLPALAGLRVPPPGPGRGPRAGRFPWQLGKPALSAPTRRPGGSRSAPRGPRAPGPRQRPSSAPYEPPPPPQSLLAHPTLTSATSRRAAAFPRCSHPPLARAGAQTRACRGASYRPRNGRGGAARGRGHEGRGAREEAGWSWASASKSQKDRPDEAGSL